MEYIKYFIYYYLSGTSFSTTFRVEKNGLQPLARRKKFLLISRVCGGLIFNLLPKPDLEKQIYNMLKYS